MKKQIQKIFLLLFLGVAQMGNAQKSINVSIGFGRPCGYGRGACDIQILNQSERATNSNFDAMTVYLDELNRLSLKILKVGLSKEIEEREFKGQYMYFLDSDIEIVTTESGNKPLILAKGWHPLIELEDCYVVSYTLKNKNK